MTRKIFWEEPYRTDLEAIVTAVDGDRVEVDRTILFAFSGGQESDAGTLGGQPVLQAQKLGRRIVYTLPPGHGLTVGSPVTMHIDWERRQRIMRLHFAAEMALQIICELRPGIERIGANISSDKARIDFACHENLAALLPAIEAQAAALIAAGKPILTRFSDESSERRYWEVEGFARMACGGTHPRTTAEVGALRFRRRNTGKGKERVEILLLDA